MHITAVDDREGGILSGKLKARGDHEISPLGHIPADGEGELTAITFINPSGP